MVIDTGWAFTWTEKQTKLQVNGTAGFTFNFEDTATHYQSGDEFHWEWAVGVEWFPGFLAGVVGYDYRQISPDSGLGAVLGPFEGRADAIGGGFSYTTDVNKSPVTFDLRHYHEHSALNRRQGDYTFMTTTARF